MNDTKQPYATDAVATAGPAQLVLMLYDGALAAIGRARQAALASERIGAHEAVNRELQRAQDIVTELQVTLDHELGGPIAANLWSLYDFCLDRLVTANVSKDLSDLPPVERVLGELREGWATACAAATTA